VGKWRDPIRTELGRDANHLRENIDCAGLDEGVAVIARYAGWIASGAGGLSMQCVSSMAVMNL